MSPSYPPTKMKPYQHQTDCWDMAHDKPSFYYALDMGCISGDAKIKATRLGIPFIITVRELHDWFHCIGRKWGWQDLPIYVKSLFYNDIIRSNRVINVIHKGTRRVVKMTLASGKTLVLTRDHKVLRTDKKWTPVGKLAMGDAILINDGPGPNGFEKKIGSPREDLVASIRPCGTDTVYDLQMADPAHNFIVEEIIVHNCGKSKVLIDDMNGHDIKLGMIICPKSVVPVWPGEFDKHSVIDYNVITIDDYPKSWTLEKKVDRVEKDIRTSLMQHRHTVFVLNYDGLLNPFWGVIYGKKNKVIGWGMLFRFKWQMIALDEAHFIKSHNGRMSWVCNYLGDIAKWKRCLSGTPAPHSPLDLYAQFRFLDKRIFGWSMTAFKARYALMGGFKEKQVIAWRDIDDLNLRFKSISHRVMKRDVLDLPPVHHDNRICELTPKMRRVYDQFANELIANVEGHEISATNALVKLLRLSQMTSGHVEYDDGHSEFLCNGKLDLLEEIVLQLDKKEPIVIFCRFTSEVQRSKKLLEKLGRTPAELSGAMRQWEAFQYYGKTINQLHGPLHERKRIYHAAEAGQFDAIVVQIQSGSAGIDLTRAAYCVFMSTGYSLGDYEQALARIDRNGQTQSVNYYHLIAERTVDELIYRALQAKRDVVEFVLDDIKAITAKQKLISAKGKLR